MRLDILVSSLLHWVLPVLALLFTVGYWTVGGAVARVWPQYTQHC